MGTETPGPLVFRLEGQPRIRIERILGEWVVSGVPELTRTFFPTKYSAFAWLVTTHYAKFPLFTSLFNAIVAPVLAGVTAAAAGTEIAVATDTSGRATDYMLFNSFGDLFSASPVEPAGLAMRLVHGGVAHMLEFRPLQHWLMLQLLSSVTAEERAQLLHASLLTRDTGLVEMTTALPGHHELLV